MHTFFDKLKVLSKKADSICIMTHRHMDLDGFGAALGLYEIIEKYNKNVYIIINEQEQDGSIKKAMEKTKKKVTFSFINSTKALDMATPSTLLIILDVHKKEMVEIPYLIDNVGKVVIMDHHLKGDQMIENIDLSYIKASVSSTVEMIVDLLKLEKQKVEPVVATIMLAGMYIDTNNFNIKTTANTYLAGAYLMQNGASNIIKQELFQENKKTFIRRQKLLKNSYMINENMILCTLDKNVYAGSELAKIAEELLQIEDVEASFAVGFVEEKLIGVSARSLGKINVEKVMKQLGGGGHKTDAAARIHGANIAKVKEKIVNILK